MAIYKGKQVTVNSVVSTAYSPRVSITLADGTPEIVYLHEVALTTDEAKDFEKHNRYDVRIQEDGKATEMLSSLNVATVEAQRVKAVEEQEKAKVEADKKASETPKTALPIVNPVTTPITAQDERKGTFRDVEIKKTK